MKHIREGGRPSRAQHGARARIRFATLVALSILPQCKGAEPTLAPAGLEAAAPTPAMTGTKDSAALGVSGATRTAGEPERKLGNPEPPVVAARRSPAPRGAAARRSRPGKPTTVGVLNLNRATEAELRLLPGIGKARASAIVQRRAMRPFATLEEVGRIRGLKGIVRKLRQRLTLSGDSTLRPADPATPSQQGAGGAQARPSG
jgi:competence protein ComEA